MTRSELNRLDAFNEHLRRALAVMPGAIKEHGGTIATVLTTTDAIYRAKMHALVTTQNREWKAIQDGAKQ